MKTSPGAPCLADFAIGRALGQGRFGNVYLATHKASGRKVAVKSLSKAALIREKCVNQLRREVETQARLRHPNIARLLAYFHDTTRAIIVVEYCEGGELFKALQRLPGRVMEEAGARRIIAGVVDALRHCHRRNVIHRDIKPENVLLDGDGVPKLADFGWSVHAPAPFDGRTTLCGTPEYLSPELAAALEASETGARTRSKHGRPADAWALGCLAFEMLTGRSPFAEPDASAGPGEAEAGTGVLGLVARIRRGDFAFPEGADASPEARDFCRRLLATDPSARMTADEACAHAWVRDLVPDRPTPEEGAASAERTGRSAPASGRRTSTGETATAGDAATGRPTAAASPPAASVRRRAPIALPSPSPRRTVALGAPRRVLAPSAAPLFNDDPAAAPSTPGKALPSSRPRPRVPASPAAPRPRSAAASRPPSAGTSSAGSRASGSSAPRSTTGSSAGSSVGSWVPKQRSRPRVRLGKALRVIPGGQSERL